MIPTLRAYALLPVFWFWWCGLCVVFVVGWVVTARPGWLAHDGRQAVRGRGGQDHIGAVPGARCGTGAREAEQSTEVWAMIDINNMPAGPEMDRLVAELVMGWSKTTDPMCFTSDAGVRCVSNDDDREILFWPSRNIAHAWEVVEKMKAVGRDVSALTRTRIEPPVFKGGEYTGAKWRVGFSVEGGGLAYPGAAEAVDESAPLAICCAALKAVGA